MPYLSKYGAARTIRIPVPKAGTANHAVGADWTPASGDVKIIKDGGAAANVTNLPTAIAMGNSAAWVFALTATEMEAAEIVVTVADSATKAVDDTGFSIETYGHASAQHAVDLDDGVRAGLTALPNAAADAAGGLPISDAGGLDLDAKLAATNEVTAARMGALTDLVDGGRLDLILDATLADTNELQGDWANGGRLDLILDARASQASVDTVDGIVDSILVDTAEIGTAGAGLTALATAANLATLSGYVDTEVAAIKAKTDNLPADPADASDIAGSFSTVNSTLATIAGYIDTEIATLQTSVNDLPTNAELATALGTADDAVLAAIAALENLSSAGAQAAVAAALTAYGAALEATAQSILADTGTDGVVVAAASKTDYRLSATGVDDVLDEVVEGSYTLRQLLRGFGAALLAKASGLDTTAAVYRDVSDSKNRISATVDADGNRTAVTLDLT